MASQIFTNISGLVSYGSESSLRHGRALGELEVLKDGFLIVEGDTIAQMGRMEDFPFRPSEGTSLSPGTYLIPAWCDSHTHLVFGNSREGEFVDRIRGLDYLQIAAKGGGILQSAAAVEQATEDSLFLSAWKRLEEVSLMGTGAIEIKSGYGLSVEGELKILRVIQKLKQKSPLEIRATFLGAHAYPKDYQNDHESYLNLIEEQLLPVIERDSLADFIDVFCEKGFFSVEEMVRICRAGKARGLPCKLHVNQLNSLGAVSAGIELEAVSMDHLEKLSAQELQLLGKYRGCATLLPSASFFLSMEYSPARALIEAGAALALATDYNPGSSPSGNMNFVVALACTQMKMLPEEAILAATLNGANAMGIGGEFGSIAVGKKANLIFTQPIPSLAYIPYRFGNNLVDKVMLRGTFI